MGESTHFIDMNDNVIGSLNKLFDTNNSIESTTRYTEDDFVKIFLRRDVKTVLRQFLYESNDYITDKDSGEGGGFVPKSGLFLFIFYDIYAPTNPTEENDVTPLIHVLGKLLQ